MMKKDDDPVVWMYWVDDPNGMARPSYLDVCLKSVISRSECKVIICDQTKAHKYLPDLPVAFDKLIPAHQADVFRVGILSKLGGMYLDFDTFVLKSLRGLFNLLDRYEYVGADWYPKNLTLKPAALGNAVLGPTRPNLHFLTQSFQKQLVLLHENSDALLSGTCYPFKWEGLLNEVVVPFFVENRPRSHLKDGANTWGALAGGPAWSGGNFGHMLMSMDDIQGRLPDTELLTIAHSCFPAETRNSSLHILRNQNTILAHLIKMID